MRLILILLTIFAFIGPLNSYAPIRTMGLFTDPIESYIKGKMYPTATELNDDPIHTQVTDILQYQDTITEEDVLWLARVAMSETMDMAEAYHIMWIVRNRVETNYRGKRTYKDVVLDPYQFSAFRPTKNRRLINIRYSYINRSYDTKNTGKWYTYLKMAAVVATRSQIWNPHEQSVRHFVHQKALTSRPSWLKSEPDVQVNTLSIYEGI